MYRYVGVIILFAFLGIALIAPAISPYDPRSYDGPTLSPPSGEYRLGTDDLGQDILSQLIYGTRTSLLVGTLVAISSTLLSVGVGLLSGYNRRLDPYMMGLCNMILSIPHLLIVIIVVAFSGSGLWNVILVLSLLSWPGYARIIRSQVLSLKEREYVKAAQTYGAKQGYILNKHILPNIYPLGIVKFVNTAKSAVVTEASLSFLGLGDVTEISWGLMLHYAFQMNSIFIGSAWQWWVLPPTLCIVLLTLGFSFLAYQGEGKLSIQRKRNRKQANQNGQLDNQLVLQEANTKSNILLQIRNLHVQYRGKKRKPEGGNQSIPALDRVSLTLNKGEILTLIGESGSGKTTLARALLGMLPSAEMTGSIFFQGKNLMELESKEWVRLRWVDISMVFQDSKQALNPVFRVGKQIDEVLKYHKGMTGRGARARTEALLQDVGLDASIVNRYPHELSGGMCTRVVIAMALACEPDLLIADEPTSSLDMITRKKVMRLLQDKVDQYQLAMLFITHDMGVVAELADTVAVIKNGRIIEQASVWDLFNTPQQSYTKKLVGDRYIPKNSFYSLRGLADASSKPGK